MKILVGFILCLYIYGCVAPPVNEKKKKKDKEHGETNEIDQQVRNFYQHVLLLS